MKKKLAPYIYSIVIVGCTMGLTTTILNYFSAPRQSSPTEEFSLINDMSEEYLNSLKTFHHNIFNLAGTIPEDGQLIDRISPCSGKEIASSLPYNVIGIIYGGNTKGSVAMLQNKNSNEILIIKKGSKLPQKGVISDIQVDRVWIVVTDCPEYIALPETKLPSARKKKHTGTEDSQFYSEPGFERSGSNTSVTREWVDDILTNKLATVLEDALATPHVVNGQIDGFTISNIEPMSVYDKLGLKNGDVVTSINDIPLTDAGQAIQTLNALKNESHIELHVTRNGQDVALRVKVQ